MFRVEEAVVRSGEGSFESQSGESLRTQRESETRVFAGAVRVDFARARLSAS